MLTAEIIGVGDELIYGETVDSNTAEIARSLQPYSVAVRRTLRVADDLSALGQEVSRCWAEARLVVLSGGLGPTPDDVTREAVAAALGEAMEPDPEVVAWLEALFAGRGWKMPEANRKQAMKIPSAAWVPNPRGTAPGWWVSLDGKDLVCLPGPPGEWKPMWAEVLPKLNLRAEPYAQVTLKTFGLGESRIVELLGDLFRREGSVEVGTYAKTDGVHVVVRGEPGGVEAFADRIRPLVAGALWGEGDQTLPELALALLKARGATLATAEAATGGVLAATLSGPGPNGAYLGGALRNARPAAAEVSEDAARRMAQDARAAQGADFALCAVGITAKDEELEGQPVGTLHVALAAPDGVRTKSLRLPGANREMLRARGAYAALAFLVGELRGGA